MPKQNLEKEEIIEKEVIEDAILTFKETSKKAPEIKEISTGIEGLDELFFTTTIENGNPKLISLGGIPQYSVFNITGILDTVKSLMAEQFAIKQASLGNSLAFITAESPAHS